MNALLRNIPVLLIVSSLLLGCADDVTSEDHLNKADDFVNESKYQEAIIELKNALIKDDSNARARATLGTIYFYQTRYVDADKELSRVLSSAMDPADVVPVLAQVLLNLGEFDRLDDLPADGLDPESRSTLLAAQGISKLYQQDVEAASALIDVAAENEPSSIYAQVAAARLSMVRNKPDEARKQLQQVFKVDQKSTAAWVLQGDIERVGGQPKKARQAYSRAIKLEKNNFEALLNRAMVRIEMGELKEAEGDLRRLERVYKKTAMLHPGVQFARGMIYMQSKQIAEATKALVKVTEFSDSYPESLYYLAGIYAGEGRTDKALSLVNQYLMLKPENAAGSKLAAKLELGNKKFRNAERLLLPVVAVNSEDIEAMNLLANARLGQGKNDAGIELLTKAVELQPESNEAQARLGAAYLSAGAEESGIGTLQGILEKDPTYDNADTLIVMYYLSQNDVTAAIEAAQEYTKRNPQAKSYVLLARTYIVNVDKERAKGAFEKALELTPGDPVAGSSLAEYALVDKDYETARAYYQQILEHNPAHMETRMRVAATFARQGSDKEMLESLDATLAAHPRAMEPRLVKARYYIANGQMEQVIPLFEALSEEQKEEPDALETMATFELAKSQFNQAVGTISRLIEKKPNTADYHFMKFRAYAGLGEKEKLSAELDRTLELNPDHFGATVAVARMALLSEDMVVFEDRLAELKKVAPQSSEVVQLEAAYVSKEGDNKRAEELLEGLFEREPTTANVIALVGLRQLAGDVNGAIARLEAWVGENTKDVIARARLAELYGSNSQEKDVMLQCREILKLEPDNIAALNNLAWYMLDKDPKQALVYAERALALAPDVSAVLDTLALAQLENNDVAAARKSIDRALSASPKSPDIRFHEVKIRAAEGDSRGAIVMLNSLLNRNEEFAELAEAEAFLEKLKSQ